MSKYINKNRKSMLPDWTKKVEAFCKSGTGGETINYVEDGKLGIYTVIVIYRLPSTCTTESGDSTGSLWFVQKEQCKDLVFNTTK